MSTKTPTQMCALSIIAHGFDEMETISIISILRQAGLCIKSVGATNGLISGVYGICLMPDLTFSDLDHFVKNTALSLIILPENKQCLSKLEADPRLHNFLRQSAGQGSSIVAGMEGRQFLKKISFGAPGSNGGHEPLLLPWEQGQSVEALAHGLVQRLR